MYYLILIVTYVANSAALQVDAIPFDDKASCQEALIEVLNGYDKNPITNGSILDPKNLHIDGFCVAKADD